MKECDDGYLKVWKRNMLLTYPSAWETIVSERKRRRRADRYKKRREAFKIYFALPSAKARYVRGFISHYLRARYKPEEMILFFLLILVCETASI